MSFQEDYCPKCGCDLWKEYNIQQNKKRETTHPEDCYCWIHRRIKKRDVKKDELIETKTINAWTGPLTNTYRDRKVTIYKCHLCGKQYVYPEILYA